MIEGQEGIRDAYRDEAVAREYVARRFVEPLGALLHQRQVAHLRAVIRALAPSRVLEIAPGPARLTVDVAQSLPRAGTLLDASAQMLAEARQRLKSSSLHGWHLVQGDAFHLPFAGPFDLVYTFRLIRHFEESDRARLYSGLARLLRPGGNLVFDAVNERVARTVRDQSRGCEHYDALLTRERVTSELGAAGFTRIRFTEVQRRYPFLYQIQVLVAPRSKWLATQAMALVDRIPGGEPLEWIVTCERG